MNKKIFYPSAGLFCSLLLGACATWQRHGVVLKPPQKLQIAVLPIRSAVHIKKLTKEEMNKITAEMTSSLRDKLKETYFFEPVSYDPGLEGPLTKEKAKQIGAKLHVPAILTVRMDGYGKIRPSWLTFLMLTAVVEATAQGAITAATVGNVWVAVGVASAEIGQESAEWIGGTLLFNKLFTPVILEAKLWSTVDGGELWHKTVIATPHRKAIKQLSKSDKKKREIRLQLSSDRAQESIIQSLEKRAAANLKSP